MSLIRGLMFFFMDMFLIIQCALVSGNFGDADRFAIDFLDSNPIFWTLGIGVSSWGVIIGILGLIYLGFCIFQSTKIITVPDSQTFDNVIFIVYIVFCVCSIL